MTKIEQYILDNHVSVCACDKYIGCDNIVVTKDKIYNNIIKSFKNSTDDICARVGIPFEKGEYWQLPNSLVLGRGRIFKFVYNKDISFDYKYIDMFYELTYCPDDIDFYYTTRDFGKPILKVFENNVFIGAISGIVSKQYYEILKHI